MGKVKTRLAATVGDEKSLRIYKALLTHTRAVALQVRAHRYLFYGDYINEKDDWDPAFFTKRLQKGKDIGERMAHAFSETLKTHDRVILVGGDIPELSPAILEEALTGLFSADFVIGPARDGGYYLLGMRAFEPSIFQDISWSTPSVFEQTIQDIKSLGKTCQLLPRLSDVDYEEDWIRYGWAL